MNYWSGMPEFNQQKIIDIKISASVDGSVVFVRFRNKNDMIEFIGRARYFDGKTAYFDCRKSLADAAEQKVTEKTKSIWFPYKPHRSEKKEIYVASKDIKNKYPIYIVSKGRSHNGLTTKALAEMRVNHFIVIEENELDAYRATKNKFAELLVLPEKYKQEYDTCDSLGMTKSVGPGAARNFCIDHSLANGSKKHWVMDDNLDAFHHLNNNKKKECNSSSVFYLSECFIDKFSNVPVAGLNYYSFAKSGDPVPPFVANTRIYSCLLIDNESGYRWRGRYNEDTDLSLRVLKDGLCTIQLNAFLCGKVTTQRMRGGNSADFYDSEGTLPKSKMLSELHPDVSAVVWKFNRWHHHVDYSRFKSNQLIEKANQEKIENIDFNIVEVGA